MQWINEMAAEDLRKLIMKMCDCVSDAKEFVEKSSPSGKKTYAPPRPKGAWGNGAPKASEEEHEEGDEDVMAATMAVL